MSNAALDSIVAAFRVLILLVLAGLLVLTIVTWKRYPRTALFVLLGFAAFALGNLIGLASGFITTGMSIGTLRLVLLVVNALASLLDVAGLGLLGVALFLRRPKEEPVPQPPAPYYGMQPTSPQPSPAGPPPPPPPQPGPGGPTPLWPGNQGQ